MLVFSLRVGIIVTLIYCPIIPVTLILATLDVCAIHLLSPSPQNSANLFLRSTNMSHIHVSHTYFMNLVEPSSSECDIAIAFCLVSVREFMRLNLAFPGRIFVIMTVLNI